MKPEYPVIHIGRTVFWGNFCLRSWRGFKCERSGAVSCLRTVSQCAEASYHVPFCMQFSQQDHPESSL